MTKTAHNPGSRSNKYRLLIIAIVAFILFVLSILGINFYIAKQIGHDTDIIDIAARQKTLSQQITRAITEFELLAVKQLLENTTLEPEKNIITPSDNYLSDQQIALDNYYVGRLADLRAELQTQVAVFDWTLESFIHGGKTLDTFNNPIELSPAETAIAQEKLNETEVIWRYFKERVDIIMTLPPSEFLNPEEINTTLGEASAYAQKNNHRILQLMNELTQELTRNTSQKAAYLRLVQFGGIIGVLLFFLIIMYYITLRLRSADRKLDQAKQETDEIMANVHGGLFLLDKTLHIGSQYSAELSQIFNKSNLAGKRFDRLLKDFLPKDTLETAIDYINLLLGDRVNERLVASLNPMDELEVNMPNGEGGFDTKYLEFNFNRTTRAGDNQNLLVTVNDVSRRVKLARELQESNEHREEQLELLMNVLHINPQELLGFIDEADASLNTINSTLRDSNKADMGSQDRIDKIYRLAHSLKGDASALDLQSFARMVHQFESELENIKKIRDPDGNDFIPLVVQLEDLLNHLQGIKEIALRLSGLSRTFAASKQEADDSASANDNWAFITQLKDKVCQEEGKLAELNLSGISDEYIPAGYRKLVKDVLIQLTRNAIVHGIEAPDVRIAHGKETEGAISARFHALDADHYELIFRDDGGGISREAVLAAAIDKGLLKKAQADKLSGNQVYGLIFRPGFSTADNSSANAGRGVGMDLVKTRVQQYQGRLRFKTGVGQYTEFRIILPVTITEPNPA